MSDDNVVQLPPLTEPPEWIIGPFESWRVVIDGRMIPRLNAFRQTDGRVTLILDGRFLLDLPSDGIARRVADFVANALAIGAGYPWMGADGKEMPFAPKVSEVKL